MRTLRFPELFRAEGLNVEIMDGWDQPHVRSGKPYLWRNTAGPDASQWHHTATPAYTPNRIKANMYAGLLYPGSQRLYQSGGGVPTIVFANAYPGPITSGYGQEAVLDLAKADIPNNERATGPDDLNPRWAGNRSYWNTEIVLDGAGTWVDDEVWEMLVTAAAVLHRHMGWSPARAIGHSQHTRRKPDLWSGEDISTRETMIRFRADLTTALAGPAPPPPPIDEEDDMATQEEFVEYIRYADIDKMAADGIIGANEAHYFKVEDPWPGPGEDNDLKVRDHPDWENLYLAWKVRVPIWAV